jgi:hypothetical protein
MAKEQRPQHQVSPPPALSSAAPAVVLTWSDCHFLPGRVAAGRSRRAADRA